MPELPDVALFKRHLKATALNREMASPGVKDNRILFGILSQALVGRLQSANFTSTWRPSTWRHGKHLLIQVDKCGCLVMYSFHC